MNNRLQGKSIVITGASSGMGRATAIAFARRGANLVLTARREEPLQAAARDVEALGVQAIAVPADVTDVSEMRAVAQAAVERFGSIDIWMNIAGLSLWGRFADIPVEAQQELIRVNLLGVINGSHAALPHMLSAGGRGMIVNMASISGRIPQPFAAAYSASKFGVAGFTEALRYELRSETSIEVCGVYPGFVDTPTDIHSANYTGRTLRPLPPVIAPERVAEAMIGLLLRPRRALHIGLHHLSAAAYHVAPEPSGRLFGIISRRHFIEAGPAAADFEGTLFQPVAEGTGIHGGWGAPQRKRRNSGAAVALAAIAAASALGAFMLSRWTVPGEHGGRQTRIPRS